MLVQRQKKGRTQGFVPIKMNATEELQMIDSYDKIDAVLERVEGD